MADFRQVLTACLILAAPAHAEDPTPEPKAVVELFTSQGCSSCVPADEYLTKLAYRDDVIALSLHVDYWDYLGWRDTFAEPEHAERQRDYAAMRGSHRIYTPQVVVNGRVDLVGSDRKSVEAAIESARLPLPVAMRRGDGTVEIEVGAHPLPRTWPMTVWLVLFSSVGEVDIQRGENAGHTIAYHNVVRAMRPIGMWDGGVVKVTLPADELMGKGVDSCAVLVQEDRPDGPGAIVGAAMLGKW
jgi:hypothetical protein